MSITISIINIKNQLTHNSHSKNIFIIINNYYTYLTRDVEGVGEGNALRCFFKGTEEF